MEQAVETLQETIFLNEESAHQAKSETATRADAVARKIVYEAELNTPDTGRRVYVKLEDGEEGIGCFGFSPDDTTEEKYWVVADKEGKLRKIILAVVQWWEL